MIELRADDVLGDITAAGQDMLVCVGRHVELASCLCSFYFLSKRSFCSAKEKLIAWESPGGGLLLWSAALSVELIVHTVRCKFVSLFLCDVSLLPYVHIFHLTE